VRTAATAVRGDRGVPTWLLASAGPGLLASRAVAHPSRPLLALMFASIGAASVADPSVRNRPRLHPLAVLVAGGCAVWFAGVLAGAPPPLPRGSLLAAIGLNTLAAVAEEALFRRFLFDRTFPRFGAVGAVLLTALLFAAVHVPLFGASVFWVDLGAGLLFGWQRWASGSWTVPAATHALANLLVVLR